MEMMSELLAKERIELARGFVLREEEELSRTVVILLQGTPCRLVELAVDGGRWSGT
jgi:hypothetical protein